MTRHDIGEEQAGATPAVSMERFVAEAAFLRREYASLARLSPFGRELLEEFDAAVEWALVHLPRINDPWRYLVAATHSSFVDRADAGILWRPGASSIDDPDAPADARVVDSIVSAHSAREKQDEETRRRLAPVLADVVALALFDVERGSPDLDRFSIARVMVRRSWEVAESDATFAVHLARVAVAACRAEAHRDGRAAERLEARARREEASALRLEGRFDEALLAVDHARRLLRGGVGSSRFELALLAFVAASVHLNRGDLERAAKELHGLAAEFARHGDAHMRLQSDILVAHMEYRRAQYAAASDAYANALGQLPQGAELAGRLYGNLGNCHFELGDFVAAERAYAEAQRILGQHKSVAQFIFLWRQGRVAMQRGDFERAERLLKHAAQQLLVAKRFHDVALIDLDLIDLLLATRRAREVKPLLKTVIGYFKTAGHRSAMLRALAQLRDLPQRRVTTDAVDEVRRAVHAANAPPNVAFSPAS